MVKNFKKYLKRVDSLIPRGWRPRILTEFEKWSVKAYYDISKKDLEASEVLFKNKNYSLSCYHLQQSLEKLGKSFLIAVSAATVETISRHDYMQRKLDKVKKNKELLDLLRGLTKEKVINTIEKTEIVEVVNKNYYEIQVLQAEEIKNIMYKLDEIEQKCLDNNFLERLLSDVKSKEFRSFILKQVEKSRYKVESSQVNKYTTTDMLKKYLKRIFLQPKIMLLNVLVYPHWNTTRYPKRKEDEKIDFFFYREDVGIVQIMPELLEKVKILLGDFKESHIDSLVD